ncbi:MAG: virulence factor MviN [Propionibacteriaceae bacterium]|nr:virulence factor MviN [Propionibacteriaceae bacterium]
MRPTRFGSVALGLVALTLASRIVGFGRWLVFSKTVGDTCLGDVYNAANQLPNVLFEIVAGGVLAGVVIPVVARHVGGRRTEAVSITASALITWTVIALTPAALAAWLGARAYASVFAAPSCPGAASTLAALLVVFVPQIWLYGLAVVSAGVLQAHSKFLAAAAAPLLSSVVVILAYLAFDGLVPDSARSDLTAMTRQALAVLGWGTTAGVLVLALVTLVPMLRLGLRLRPRLRFASGDTRVIVGIALAGLAGLIMQQLSQLLIIWAARQANDPGAVTRITWANAIYLLPFAVLVAPLLQLTFPRLSAAAELGPAGVSAVLAGVLPVVGFMSFLGAALLVGTAVPVARVFVLGPGSGRTDALAVPIAAFAPAVVGFALLGLASRTLLAQHLARASGTATVAAWGTVIAAVVVVLGTVPPAWLVPGLSAAVSVGMLVGAIVGWILTARTVPLPPSWRRPLLVSGVAAVTAGLSTAALSRLLVDAGIWLSFVGAVGCALACTAVFVAVVFVGDRPLLRQVLALRRRQPELVQP